MIIALNLTYGTSAYIFKTFFALFYKYAYIWLDMLLFMSNVSIINVFYHIFVSEVILKHKLLKQNVLQPHF